MKKFRVRIATTLFAAIAIAQFVVCADGKARDSHPNTTGNNEQIAGNGSGNGAEDTSPVTITYNGDDFTVNLWETSFDMVFVRGGTFTMGHCPPEPEKKFHGIPVFSFDICDDDVKPAHQVTLDDFFIGKYEVTQAQWMAVMGTAPSRFEGCDLPVENVSWDDVREFIAVLNAKAGRHYRLPTEAEWEYAARGGAKSKKFKYAGSNNLGDVAWHASNSNHRTHPVGTKAPNELGIYDMSGNVFEWVNDWYGSYTADAKINPDGPDSGSHRVNRGGSFVMLRCCSAKYSRVANRRKHEPGARSDDLGFRLALSHSN